MILPEPVIRFQSSWVLLSVGLLVLYLAFFHFCLNASYMACVAAGVFTWVIWMVVCSTCRSLFLNRFEYWIHCLIGLDVLLEGFSPIHEGLGFYYCAASFWLVILIYHSVGAKEYSLTALQSESSKIKFAR